MEKNGYGHIVLDYYVERLRAMRAERHERLSKLKTKEDAIAYQQYVRGVVDKAFGPWPERVPLDIQYGETLQRDGYRIEKVSFNSRPNFRVTADLYIPDGLKGKAPAVLGSCGHGIEGKATDTYQSFSVRLVKNGFVVLLYDPIQQGERDQYVNLENRGVGKGLCDAHNVMGKQLELLGENFCGWRVWDGRCALDVLLSRPEVDPTRIGMTGNSGGGTLSEWIWANEPRLTMCAPSCHVTSFLTNLENELPTDAEQCPPGVIGAGLEMVDLMYTQAPKPVMLLGQRYDSFERRGLKEAYADLKAFYKLFGAEDKVELFIGPTQHGYSKHNQDAMVGFFRRISGMEGEQVFMDPVLESQDTLAVLPEKNVVKAGSTPIQDIIREKAAALAAVCKPIAVNEWKSLLGNVLQLPEVPAEPPHFRVPRALKVAGKTWARYAVETEGSVRAIMRKRMVNGGLANSLDVEEEVHLYLPHTSVEIDANENDFMKGINADGVLYALDVRGLGESMPEEPSGGFFQSYGMDYMMHCFGLMFGESYLGRRVFDVLRTIQLLKSEGAKKIHLYGRGQGAIIAAFAGMLDDAVVTVTLADTPKSFQEWTDYAIPSWPSAMMPWAVLKSFDLPDLYKEYGDRLTIVSNWNALMQ
ncbi:MAG: alpha/beta hydrolase family protein [Lentisphaeria bacterium]|nr:alpha/beta hydrolase family protein [Lentisphaeria bacterium]